MFLKRLLTLFLIGLSFSVIAAKIPVLVKYSTLTLSNNEKPVDLVEWISIGAKGNEVVFEKTDSLYRNWKISGNGYEGNARLFVSKERGIGWTIRSGEDSLKVLIARDYKNTNDPRIISISTSFISGLFIVENFEPDCNSNFRVYSLKNSWDADVEYTGAYALEMQHSDPCAAGHWTVKTGKLKIPEKVLYMAVFTGIMTQNIRHLFKDFSI